MIILATNIYQDYESDVPEIDYLSDHTGKRITPITKPSDSTHLFRPPPGFRANRQFNIAHNITSDRSQPKVSKEYLETYSLVKKMGAGMIFDEVGDIRKFDPSDIVEDDARRIISADWPPAMK